MKSTKGREGLLHSLQLNCRNLAAVVILIVIFAFISVGSYYVVTQKDSLRLAVWLGIFFLGIILLLVCAYMIIIYLRGYSSSGSSVSERSSEFRSSYDASCEDFASGSAIFHLPNYLETGRSTPGCETDPRLLPGESSSNRACVQRTVYNCRSLNRRPESADPMKYAFSKECVIDEQPSAKNYGETPNASSGCDKGVSGQGRNLQSLSTPDLTRCAQKSTSKRNGRYSGRRTVRKNNSQSVMISGLPSIKRSSSETKIHKVRSKKLKKGVSGLDEIFWRYKEETEQLERERLVSKDNVQLGRNKCMTDYPTEGIREESAKYSSKKSETFQFRSSSDINNIYTGKHWQPLCPLEVRVKGSSEEDQQIALS